MQLVETSPGKPAAAGESATKRARPAEGGSVKTAVLLDVQAVGDRGGDASQLWRAYRVYEASWDSGNPGLVRRTFGRLEATVLSSRLSALDEAGLALFLLTPAGIVAIVPDWCSEQYIAGLREVGVVPYTAGEVRALLGTDSDTLAVVHRYKAEFGGTVVDGTWGAGAPASGGVVARPRSTAPVQKPEPEPQPRRRVRRDDPARVRAAGTVLTALAGRVASCTACALCRSRTNPVPGEGNPVARVVFVGEAPGRHEDASGRPFVGRAGAVLERLLRSVGLRRREVFIANVVKCRPPNNRQPYPEEVEACRQYLRQQLAVISPDLVVCLGGTALSWFFPQSSIRACRGTIRVTREGYRVYATFHPAAVFYKPEVEEALAEDFRRIPSLL